MQKKKKKNLAIHIITTLGHGHDCVGPIKAWTLLETEGGLSPFCFTSW